MSIVNVEEIVINFLLNTPVDTLYFIYIKDIKTLQKIHLLFGSIREILNVIYDPLLSKELCKFYGVKSTLLLNEFFDEYDKVYLFKHNLSDEYILIKWKYNIDSRVVIEELCKLRRIELVDLILSTEHLTYSTDHLEAIATGVYNDIDLLNKYVVFAQTGPNKGENDYYFYNSAVMEACKRGSDLSIYDKDRLLYYSSGYINACIENANWRGFRFLYGIMNEESRNRIKQTNLKRLIIQGGNVELLKNIDSVPEDILDLLDIKNISRRESLGEALVSNSTEMLEYFDIRKEEISNALLENIDFGLNLHVDNDIISTRFLYEIGYDISTLDTASAIMVLFERNELGDYKHKVEIILEEEEWRAVYISR